MGESAICSGKSDQFQMVSAYQIVGRTNGSVYADEGAGDPPASALFFGIFELVALNADHGAVKIGDRLEVVKFVDRLIDRHFA